MIRKTKRRNYCHDPIRWIWLSCLRRQPVISNQLLHYVQQLMPHTRPSAIQKAAVTGLMMRSFRYQRNGILQSVLDVDNSLPDH